MFQAILFYLFATVLVGAALVVVFARNPVHSVMFLVLTFFQSAILWLMAEAYQLLQQFLRTFERVESLSDELGDANFELQETEEAIVRFYHWLGDRDSASAEAAAA